MSKKIFEKSCISSCVSLCPLTASYRLLLGQLQAMVRIKFRSLAGLKKIYIDLIPQTYFRYEMKKKSPFYPLSQMMWARFQWGKPLYMKHLSFNAWDLALMILDDTSKAGLALYIEATHSISTQVQNHVACKIGTNRVQVEYASVSSDTSINIKSQTWDWVHVWGILLHHVGKDYQ